MNANSNNILDEKLLTLLDDFVTFTLVVPLWFTHIPFVDTFLLTIKTPKNCNFYKGAIYE